MNEPWHKVVDPNRVSAARMYDLVLGGGDNLQIDRDAVAAIEARIPFYRPAIHANRDFLRRVVRYLEEEQGIRQFIDIGAGLPTRGNVHEVAERSKVVYIDNDPEVIVHAHALMSGSDRVRIVEGDVRRPAEILDHRDVRHFLDWRERVAILSIAVLHFVPDGESGSDGSVYDAVEEFKSAAAAGSYLAISHGTAEGFDPDSNDHVNRQYGSARNRPFMRSRAAIQRFFNGCELVTPGLVEVSDWRPDVDTFKPPFERLGVLGGVGRIPVGVDGR
jgi:hypothetical protein